MVRFAAAAFAGVFCLSFSVPSYGQSADEAVSGPVIRSGIFRVTAKIVQQAPFTAPLSCEAGIFGTGGAATRAAGLQLASQNINVAKPIGPNGVCSIDLKFDKWPMNADFGQPVDFGVMTAPVSQLNNLKDPVYNGSWAQIAKVPAANGKITIVDFGTIVVK